MNSGGSKIINILLIFSHDFNLLSADMAFSLDLMFS
jgi:hypothetical protein